MGCFSCINGTQKKQRKEEERQASAEARARAAEAATRRYSLSFSLSPVLRFDFPDYESEEDFKKSADGRAAQAQLQQMAKQSANTNKGEPVLKWQMT